MKHIFSMLLVSILLSGCAPVKFYSDPALSKSTGFKYYTSKPYVQVEKEITSGNIVKAGIIYLPDLENPQYLEMRNGPGSKKAEIKLSEGIITLFSVESDPAIAESIEAVAGLLSKGSAALEDLSKLKGAWPATSNTTVSELYEVIMRDGATTLKKISFTGN